MSDIGIFLIPNIGVSVGPKNPILVCKVVMGSMGKVLKLIVN